MKNRIAVAFFSFLLACVPVIVLGQSGIPASDGELTPAVRARIDRGDGRSGSVTASEAAQQYQAAVEIARQEGHLPSLSMWRLANTFFHDGQFTRSTRVLDDLANEAARAGDLKVQALAIYYSAWVNGKAGRGREMTDRLKQVKKLLDSPFMPVSVRMQVGELLGPPTSVAKEH
jgi:hypothetical protein